MASLLAAGRRLYSAICGFEDVFCTIGLYISTLLIFIQVVNRFILQIGVVWVLDLALYVYMMTVFLAATIATRERGHVAVDYFYNRWLGHRPVGMARYVLALTLVSLAIALTFLPPAWQFMLKSMQFQQYSALLPGFDTNWIKVVFSLSFLVVLLHLTVNAWQEFQIARAKANTMSSREEPK